ncbi:class I SAM-dependent methyltransferase [Croceitalea sp. MTPC9]|uniref:methyltransferase domain-containing protein n=1 Tax=unclassified Croceitalea TaxID=2632280 RepID=UPI002B3C4CC3|nr:class I SAM-dependent methyltransferase [Croceitalea sp. MTPC6]GMN15684.1 class I SAM-dependent methyltransferase [Croceitalea sp. MTPC9]
MQLALRNTETELMDNPDLGVSELEKVFKDINRVNAILGGSSISLKEIQELIKLHPKKSYTILDMGCGDGYMLRKVALLLRKRNVDAQLIGIDLREDILSIAKNASMDFPEISFKKQDVLELNPKDFHCDILLCTLTIHHFDNKEISVFLEKFIAISKIGVIINDLQRSELACYLFKIFRFFFLKTTIAKKDGLTSIKSGFRKSELQRFAKNIPNVIHKIRWKWAFRYVWVLQLNRL